MTDLLAACSQMAISLGFHIILAVGIATPFFMAISYWQWLKTKEPVYLALSETEELAEDAAGRWLIDLCDAYILNPELAILTSLG